MQHSWNIFALGPDAPLHPTPPATCEKVNDEAMLVPSLTVALGATVPTARVRPFLRRRARSHGITAVYGGDANFTATRSAVLTQLVQDFQFVIGGGGAAGAVLSASVPPGGVATYQFQVSPTNGMTFPSAVTSSASGRTGRETLAANVRDYAGLCHLVRRMVGQCVCGLPVVCHSGNKRRGHDQARSAT